MSRGRTALVTGATGTLGPWLIRLLQSRDVQVRALVRSRTLVSRLSANVSNVEGDLADLPSLQRAVDGMDCVFHLAAKLHINNPSPSLREEYVRTNREGTRLLVRAAREAGVRRFVFFSTICVYGPGRTGGVLTEDSPAHPDTPYACTKAEAERIVLEECPGVVLRLAAVYGPTMQGNYRHLLRALRKRVFVPVGEQTNRRTLVYVTDACEAAALVATHPEAEGEIFNVTDGQIHRLKDILAAMGRALGVDVPSSGIPVGAAQWAASGVDALVRMAGGGRGTASRLLDKLLEDVAVSGERFGRLGFRPRIGLEEGWRLTVEGEKTAGASS